MPMLVYRIERDGRGPYIGRQSGKSQEETVLLSEMFHHHCHDDDHPGIKSDALDKENWDSMEYDYSCGCESLEKLMDWFGDYFPKLIKFGWQMRVYRIAKKYVKPGISGRQVAFQIDKAKALV